MSGSSGQRRRPFGPPRRPSRRGSTSDDSRHTVLFVSAILCSTFLVAGAHWRSLSARALSFDDKEYLVDNRLVQNPSWESAGRFLSEVLGPSTVHGYYQPLTMISLMADCAMGGRPDDLVPFHRTSLTLHLLNTVLVVLLMHLLFEQPAVAVIVGLLFGLHPMTVETIPWIGERKTLLAAFFGLSSLILFVRHVRVGGLLWYGMSLAAFVLALMSKPTSTMLPVVMLLMDYWPLRRLSRRSAAEKLPFLLVAMVFAVITVISQRRTLGASLPGEYGVERIPLLLCHNIIFYLRHIVWPASLSSHYPVPNPLSPSHSAVFAGIVGTCILIPLLVLSLRWTRSLLTGWLSFFAAIFPTLGVIGFTSVVAADKFAYLPIVGLLFVIAAAMTRLWSLGSTVRSWRIIVLIAVCSLASAETIATRRYSAEWKDTETLCRYMVARTPGAAVPQNSLANELFEQGRVDEALVHFEEALRIDPAYGFAHYNCANALVQKGRFDAAIEHYRVSLQSRPTFAEAHNNLARALVLTGRIDEAIPHYERAVGLKPESVAAQYNLADALNSRGRYGEALPHCQAAIRLAPQFTAAYQVRGQALLGLGRVSEAIEALQASLQLQPKDAEVQCLVGDLLRGRGRIEEAAAAYRAALAAGPGHAGAQRGLAMLAGATASAPVR